MRHDLLFIPVFILGISCDTQTSKIEECDGGAAPTTWYIDKDMDGYGEELVSIDACEQPEGYVDIAGDCNDDYDTISPGIEEVCGDEIDNDCDEGADGDDPDILSSLWYQDFDGDGFGDPASENETGCPDEGWIADNSDCDDANDTINPNGTEICDGLDNDCSGLVDDGGDCPCDVETYDGHGYMLCDVATTFKEASYACQASGYELVSLGSAGENNWVKDQALAFALGGPWVGLRDGDADGIWEWINGEPLVYENWNIGEPNGSNELCVEMSTNSQVPGKWNDTDCSLERRYVCESQ